ncbi:MAG: DUF4625 domain-containing protein [Bacteroidetes bacterium]|nr:DUF4625 domain-containing protein [Bacteroidales bacterium]NJO68870.1 DUF4625 domain-containing protein [Bacteroidota bacterium]
MKISKYAITLLLLSILLTSCEKDNNIDKEKPLIDLSLPDAFPNNCDTFYFGEPITFKALFSDNVELGSVKAFSIDIHHNFDHHSHSTEVSDCNPDPKKAPVNPFVFIQDYDIPAGLKEYETNLSVTIPAENSSGVFDEGEYHFLVSLTDKEGWSTQKGISIKILHR